MTEPEKLYILIAKSCDDCGADVAVKLLKQPPTNDHEESLRELLGGMRCIKIYKSEGLWMDGETLTIQGPP